MSNPDDPRAWLDKVEADLLSIENNLAAQRIPWSVVGFHAQQAAEKSLKAFLVSTGDTAPRTHDLGLLLQRCMRRGTLSGGLAQDCDLLTPFAVANRYPGAGPEPTEQESRLAVNAANRIVAAVRALIVP